jgi:hypothetical protein
MPLLPEGTRRRVGAPEVATLAMPVRPPRNTIIDEETAGCFVLIAPVDVDVPAAAPEVNIAKVAVRHHMDVHVFDDGSTLLIAKRTGKAAAVEAARAALALREEVPDGAVSVFSRSTEDSLADAIDRGTMLLERGMIGTLFGDLVGNDEPVVHIDEVIADLIGTDMPIVTTVDGPVLRVLPRAQPQLAAVHEQAAHEP